MRTYQVYKIDNDYIVLHDDQPIPAVGERTYSRSAAGALAHQRDSFMNGAGPVIGATLSEISIKPNEHADADLIRRYGFSVAE